MFSTEWGTTLTNNYQTSDNTKIFQSVPTLPTKLDLNPHEYNNSNETGQRNEPRTYPPTRQIGNKNPSSESDTIVTNTSLNPYTDLITVN